MKFIIVGAGALGSILAAHLKQAGHDVTIIARGQRAAFLKDNSLRLLGIEELNIECPLVTDPSTLTETDVLIITPKTYHHAQALEQVRHIKAGSVFSVANGVQKTEHILDVFGIEHGLGCIADLSGELLENGEVLFTRNVDLQIGALSTEVKAGAEEVAKAINDSGINCHAVKNIRDVEWSKFLSWLGFLALSVITRLPSYRFLLEPSAVSLLYSIIMEMKLLASRHNIEIRNYGSIPISTITTVSPEEAKKVIREIGEFMKVNAPEHKMSALQDLENGRPLELEETMGDALAKAKQVNVEMPTIEACYRLLSAINNN